MTPPLHRKAGNLGDRYHRCCHEGCCSRTVGEHRYCGEHGGPRYIPEGSTEAMQFSAEAPRIWAIEDLIVHVHRCAHCRQVRPRVLWQMTPKELAEFHASACPDGKSISIRLL